MPATSLPSHTTGFFLLLMGVFLPSLLQGAPRKKPVARPLQVKIVEKAGMMRLSSGFYSPLYAKKKTRIRVRSFWLDKTAVTNQQFLAFVRKHPRWRRSRVSPLFADKSYLKHWASDLSFGKYAARLAKAPVTHVSWFPARYYCRSQGKRLPTLAEWEYAGAASKTRIYAQKNPAYVQRILQWYSRPTPNFLPPVGRGFRNIWGVYELHGLIWEWVSDFNTALVTGDSRGDSSVNKQLFCGASAIGARDFSNYASFMRYAYRSSLKARYGTANLGFRCARSTQPQEKQR